MGLDISESPRRSIVLGPRAALQPFPSPPGPRALARSPLALVARSRCPASTRSALYTAAPFPRSSSLAMLGILSARGNTERPRGAPQGIGWEEEEEGIAFSRWGF